MEEGQCPFGKTSVERAYIQHSIREFRSGEMGLMIGRFPLQRYGFLQGGIRRVSLPDRFYDRCSFRDQVPKWEGSILAIRNGLPSSLLVCFNNDGTTNIQNSPLPSRYLGIAPRRGIRYLAVKNSLDNIFMHPNIRTAIAEHAHARYH